MLIDAHILCTPSIGDIDADGHDELVVAASYFFDREYYDDPVRPQPLALLAKTLNPHELVAAAPFLTTTFLRICAQQALNLRTLRYNEAQPYDGQRPACFQRMSYAPIPADTA